MKSILKKIVSLTGYSLINTRALEAQRNERPVTRENFFDIYFAHVDPKTFFFIQIGANDGKTEDPIYPYISKYSLSGIAIEPVPDVFQLLKQTYQDNPNVECLNVAIGKTSGSMPFYGARRPEVMQENSYTLTRTASFNKQIVIRSLKTSYHPALIRKITCRKSP